MLKIWLTWLQPSLGILGAALVLCNPLATYAASKPAASNSVATKKTPVQSTQWSRFRSNGTRIDSELSSAVAITPDMAVRQMAVGTLSSSSMAAPASIPQINPIAKAPQQSNRSVIGKFAPTTKVGQLTAKTATKKVGQITAKATKPRQIDNSVAEALARASKPLPPIPVPGLFIGNADVKVSKQVLPTAKPLAQAIASTAIGAPTPLSAMMGTKPIAADPFPVVRPELMQKIQRTSATMASVPTVPTVKIAPVSLDPIAAIPTRKNNKVVADIKAIAPNSLDPIANIPSGLQQMLGNKLDDLEIVATAPSTKTNPTTVDSMAGIRQMVAPDSTPTISAASLRLATARAYSNSAPKFNIPGETLLTAKSVAPAVSVPNFYIPGESSLTAKPTKNVLVAKTVRQPFVTANTRQRNYTEIVSETFAPTVKPAWMSADRRNSLGGLILGSQPQPAATTSLVGGFATTSNRNGLQPRSLANFQ